MKTSGSSATLKAGKQSSNIYCTWQKTILRVKRRKFCHKLLHLHFCLPLFKSEGCRSDLASLAITGSALLHGILFLHLPAILMCATKCPAAQTSCCTAGSERIWAESGLSLYLSLLSKRVCLKLLEEGWMLTSTQPCQLAAKIEAHVGEPSSVTIITQPTSPTYVTGNAILPARIFYTGLCRWVLPIVITHVPKSIDFETEDLKASEFPAFW